MSEKQLDRFHLPFTVLFALGLIQEFKLCFCVLTAGLDLWSARRPRTARKAALIAMIGPIGLKTGVGESAGQAGRDGVAVRCRGTMRCSRSDRKC